MLNWDETLTWENIQTVDIKHLQDLFKNLKIVYDYAAALLSDVKTVPYNQGGEYKDFLNKFTFFERMYPSNSKNMQLDVWQNYYDSHLFASATKYNLDPNEYDVEFNFEENSLITRAFIDINSSRIVVAKKVYTGFTPITSHIIGGSSSSMLQLSTIRSSLTEQNLILHVPYNKSWLGYFSNNKSFDGIITRKNSLAEWVSSRRKMLDLLHFIPNYKYTLNSDFEFRNTTTTSYASSAYYNYQIHTYQISPPINNTSNGTLSYIPDISAYTTNDGNASSNIRFTSNLIYCTNIKLDYDFDVYITSRHYSSTIPGFDIEVDAYNSYVVGSVISDVEDMASYITTAGNIQTTGWKFIDEWPSTGSGWSMTLPSLTVDMDDVIDVYGAYVISKINVVDLLGL